MSHRPPPPSSSSAQSASARGRSSSRPPSSSTPSAPPSNDDKERHDLDSRYQRLVPVRNEALLLHRRRVREQRRTEAQARRVSSSSSSDRHARLLDEMCRSAPSRAAASSLLETSSLLATRRAMAAPSPGGGGGGGGGSASGWDAALSMALLRQIQLDEDGSGSGDDGDCRPFEAAAAADSNKRGEEDDDGGGRVSWRDAYRGEGTGMGGFEMSAGDVADAFFDEYPDCIASDYDDSSSMTTSSDDDDGDHSFRGGDCGKRGGQTAAAAVRATDDDASGRVNPPQHAFQELYQRVGPSGVGRAPAAPGVADGGGQVAGHPNRRDPAPAPAAAFSGLTQESRFDYDGGGRKKAAAAAVSNPYGGPRPASAESRGHDPPGMDDDRRRGGGDVVVGDGGGDNPYRHESWEAHNRSRVVQARGGAPNQHHGYQPPHPQQQRQQHSQPHQQNQQRWQQQQQNPYQQQQPYQPPQKPNPFRTASEFAGGGGGADGNRDRDRDRDPDDDDDGGWGGFHDGGGPRAAAPAPPPAPPPPPAPAPRGGPTLSAGLKRKFQPPRKRAANQERPREPKGGTTRTTSGGGNGGATAARPSSSHSNHAAADDDDDLPEELRGLDKELIDKITSEILHSGESVTFADIAGLEDAKQTVLELVCWPMKRPDLFTGLRRGPNGLLLFGPPGTGKTLIGKAIAHESGATFFSISSSSLTSKWIGEGEKLVRTLFAVAAVNEPAVVFIDEIDSLLTQRKADENEASRRIKTEFLVQLDGTGTSGRGRVLVIGATNRPHELDDAARRRFVKRLYIPLPAKTDRNQLLHTLLRTNRHSLSEHDMDRLSGDTDGFSGADLKALCTDAALGPIRQLGERALTVDPADVPPISYRHFRRALRGMNPSVAPADLAVYLEWNSVYGSKNAAEGGDLTNDSDDEED